MAKSRIKTIGFTVCLIAALVFVFSSCSKKKMTYKKIAGTWYWTSDPSCRWTFDEYEGWGGGYLHINKLGAANKLTCRYKIRNNTLELFESTSGISENTIASSGNTIIDTYLSIDHITKNSMHISGIIQSQYYDDVYYGGVLHYSGDAEEIEINYKFKKSN